MAKYNLNSYDQNKAPAITIDCELNTTPESVFISYKLQGALSCLDLGSGQPHHARVMKLWEKSCFELFIKNADNNYIEFNFSPEFEFNCFYFVSAGDKLVEYSRMDSVKIDILLSLDVFHLIAELDKKKFPESFFLNKTDLKAGITSVIKEKSGNLSYWALSHQDTRPNFHDFKSFAATL